jgi:hypothetical protein
MTKPVTHAEGLEHMLLEVVVAPVPEMISS